MKSNITPGGRQPGQRAESSGSHAGEPQEKFTTGLKDVPQEVFEDHVIPAAKALGDGTLMALGATDKHTHRQVMRSTAVPLAVMLRKHVASFEVPSLSDDLAVGHLADGIRAGGVNLGESLYALRRLEQLFELRGHHNTWPALGHGPPRPESWCMEQIDTALRDFVDGQHTGNLSFPAGLSEAIHNLRAARMRPLLQWEADETASSPSYFHFMIPKAVEAIRMCAEKQAKELDLGNYWVRAMPPIWLYAGQVEAVRMVGGSFRQLPPEIGQMSQLRSLHLGTCAHLLSDFFAKIPTGLKELSIESFRFSTVNSDMLRLTNLERLTLPMCMGGLPENLRELKSLVHLDISDSNFDDATCALLSNLVDLKSLILDKCGIIRFGDRPIYPKNLEILSLRGNRLTDVAQSVSRLSRLKELDISENLIEDIGSSLDGLHDLQKLNFSYNNLHEFLVSDDVLENLVELNLYRNNFEYFPMAVFSCGSLKKLNVGSDYFQADNNMWEKLPMLEDLTLDLGDSSLLGSNIDECHQLKTLRLGRLTIDVDQIAGRKIHDAVVDKLGLRIRS